MFLVLASALAAPIGDGLQARIHPAGFDFLSEQLDARSLAVGPLDYAGEVSCYDLTVDDFNLTVVLDDVTIQPTANGLMVDVALHAEGTYIAVAGASGWLDTCLDFSGLIELVALQNGHLSGELLGRVENGQLVLDFAQPPQVEGEITTDADWFPDDLTWYFVHDLVLSQARSALEEEVPALVRDLTSDTLLVAELGETPITIDVTAVSADADGLYAAVAVDLGGAGHPGRPLDLGPRGGSHFAVGVTEAMAQGALELGMQSGLLDLSSPENAALLNDLIAGLGLPVDIRPQLSLAQTPIVEFAPNTMRAVLPGIALMVDDAGGNRLLEFAGNVAGTLDVGVDGGSLLLSAHDVEIEVTHLQADTLMTGDQAEADLQAFVEGWVARASSTMINGMPVYSSRFEAAGYVLRIEDVEGQDDGVVAWATMFAANDPAVDRLAPETEIVSLAGDTAATIRADFIGHDDRSGDLQYAYRLDGRGWSSWIDDEFAIIAVTSGYHTLEVISRDGWHNEDPTPALVSFEMEDLPPVPKGRGCSTSAGATSAVGGLLALFALGTRRR